jgi:GNAT superfamily N-acetyltransferase
MDVFKAPELLAQAHDLNGFSCGEPLMDDWLWRRALGNQTSGASRTYVVTEPGSTAGTGRVIGYYALAAGAVARAEAPPKVRRNMPEPIPVLVLCRIAVDEEWQGRGIGWSLLLDAVRRTLQVAEIAGVRALLVQALNTKVADFYASADFRPSPVRPLMYMLLLSEAKKGLGVM